MKVKPLFERIRRSVHLSNFAIQVCATAVGLFLALGLEQWRMDRAEAKVTRQALAAVEDELRENRARILKQLERCRTSMNTMEAMEGYLAGLIEAKRRQRPFGAASPHANPGINLVFQAEAWETLKSQGVLRHLAPDRARRLSRYYRFSTAINDMSRENFSGEYISLFMVRLQQDPKSWAALGQADLDRFHDSLRLVQAYFQWSHHHLSQLLEICDEAAKP